MKFSPIDLAVSVLVAVVLLTFAVAGRRAAQEMEAVANCADNLRRIGIGFSLYRDQSGGVFPRTRYESGAPVTAFTGWDRPNPFASNGPAVNDVTAALFLLARDVDLPPEVFICNGAFRNGLAERWDYSRDTVTNRSNFDARIHCNYSIANPYASSAAVSNGYDLNRPAPSFALASDTNPGEEALDMPVAPDQSSRRGLRMTNSPNHQRDGQNVLFADGSVAYYQSAFVGETRENIFTSSASFPDPSTPSDVVLLPVWKTGPDLIPLRTQQRRTVFIWAMVVTLSGLSFIVWRGVRRKDTSGEAPPSWFR